MTEDRDKWRKYDHGVANPRIKHGQGTEQNVTGWTGGTSPPLEFGVGDTSENCLQIFKKYCSKFTKTPFKAKNSNFFSGEEA